MLNVWVPRPKTTSASAPGPLLQSAFPKEVCIVLYRLRKFQWLLFLGRWNNCIFPYSSCSVQLKAWILPILYRKILKVREERLAKYFKTSRTRWWQVPWVFFCLIYPKLGAEKASTWKCQWVQTHIKKIPNKVLISLAEGT